MEPDTRDRTKLTDKELLTQFTSLRDEDAFAELIERHGPMVARVCQQTLVCEQDWEDAFQAVFLVLARKARSVAWQNSIANWLYGVAWRISRRANRRQAIQIERTHAMEDLAENNDHSSTAADAAEQLLYPALYKLGDKYREPIILCHLQGKTRSEAAEELGVTESIVKGRLERGREMLRKVLAKNGAGTLSLLASGLLVSRVAHATLPRTATTSLTRASTEFANEEMAGAEEGSMEFFQRIRRLNNGCSTDLRN
ncbi:MAG: sigma-70 family RNA polymerase sigma factor [Planctomycetales bacterium]|nr:sigma-70 family RNA polymerase sigma factor [Planctomycetales bacterium]